jgi:hypothetical protein
LVSGGRIRTRSQQAQLDTPLGDPEPERPLDIPANGKGRPATTSPDDRERHHPPSPTSRLGPLAP